MNQIHDSYIYVNGGNAHTYWWLLRLIFFHASRHAMIASDAVCILNHNFKIYLVCWHNYSKLNNKFQCKSVWNNIINTVSQMRLRRTNDCNGDECIKCYSLDYNEQMLLDNNQLEATLREATLREVLENLTFNSNKVMTHHPPQQPALTSLYLHNFWVVWVGHFGQLLYFSEAGVGCLSPQEISMILE